jgi:hypothetical protein
LAYAGLRVQVERALEVAPRPHVCRVGVTRFAELVEGLIAREVSPAYNLVDQLDAFHSSQLNPNNRSY